MKRTLVLTVGAGLLALGATGCAREHGDAPPGQHEPGGTRDNAGNAATARASGANRPLGSAEAPDAWVDLERTDPAALYERYDAGGEDLDPGAGPRSDVLGTVTNVSENALQIRPEQGPPVRLQLDDTAQVTLAGNLVASSEIRPGAEVRASYRQSDGKQVLDQLELLQLPEQGRGLFQPQLQPPGATNAQPPSGQQR